MSMQSIKLLQSVFNRQFCLYGERLNWCDPSAETYTAMPL